MSLDLEPNAPQERTIRRHLPSAILPSPRVRKELSEAQMISGIDAIADLILFINTFCASTRCHYHIWKNYILDIYIVRLSAYVVAKLFK